MFSASLQKFKYGSVNVHHQAESQGEWRVSGRVPVTFQAIYLPKQNTGDFSCRNLNADKKVINFSPNRVFDPEPRDCWNQNSQSGHGLTFLMDIFQQFL